MTIASNFADKEQPKITHCTTNRTVETDLGKPTAVVEWEAPNATDNSGVANVSCIPPAGSNFNIGQTGVQCKAVDSSGNKAKCGFNVTVNGMYLFGP